MLGRQFVDLDGVRLSYIDYGGKGEPLLALHDHYACARSFAGLAEALHDEEPDNFYRAVAGFLDTII